ncbi:PIG-L deacetylase family protein [Planomonospora venezuelensis]|uniref:LmbE family N-acetylglucosaminyl deacetylase n=1 Tax=Planomonospora venezuelensis TaxID=1999 RepID=A0A841CV87_PLAVE|nr:PIG-L deacetylase family protein [Planomonospora venezuelensis]MBB5961260.1 LmbE family N-acetylglucosaminyl deacetylase [Planomonospora venezuelensis]GIM99934.1 GlcNAc-PI de-N-acetylase [Planomonospora venezuelensis]
MLRLIPERCAEILLLGAHCDDIAIGAGGALLEICRANPETRVTALVLSGGGSEREDEERAALAAFCPKADLEVTVLDVPDGRLPVHWERAKQAVEEVRRRCEPDVVLAPAPHDAHQDHRALARLVPTAFRDHLVLGYEILKWESDLAQPNVFVPLPAEALAEKWALLHEHYPSQHGRTWFDEEAFRGLARVRGVQCQSRYAEAFHSAKIVFGY